MKLHLSTRCTAMATVLAISTPIYAKKINDQLEISGWLRANIQDKSYSDDDQRLKFDAAKLAIQYNSDAISGQFEYRCYQFERICDFSSLVDANLSYHFANHPKHKITIGIQDIPFGPARNWSSNWYGGLLVNTGLEDIHNLGIKYQYPWTEQTQVELGYFPSDGGDYVGKSHDAARYSANFVSTGPQDIQHDLAERDLWLLRLKHHFALSEHSNINIGGSYWYSDLENEQMNSMGKTERWASFATLNHHNWAFTFTAGQTRTDNKDPISPHISMVGSFDTAYAVANNANFYTADVYYRFGLTENSTLSPYATLSYLDKKQTGFKDSSRYILGTQWDLKPYTIALEYIVGRNDYFIGGTEKAFAEGDSRQEQLLNMLFLYHF